MSPADMWTLPATKDICDDVAEGYMYCTLFPACGRPGLQPSLLVVPPGCSALLVFPCTLHAYTTDGGERLPFA